MCDLLIRYLSGTWNTLAFLKTSNKDFQIFIIILPNIMVLHQKCSLKPNYITTNNKQHISSSEIVMIT